MIKWILIIEPAGELFESPLGSSKDVQPVSQANHEAAKLLEQACEKASSFASLQPNLSNDCFQLAGRPIGRLEASYQKLKALLKRRAKLNETIRFHSMIERI